MARMTADGVRGVALVALLVLGLVRCGGPFVVRNESKQEALPADQTVPEPVLTDRACPHRGAPGRSAESPFDEQLFSTRIAGSDRVVSEQGRDDRAPVADQAARDLACPIERVHVARSADSFAWAVEACGHHGAYLGATRVILSVAVPGHEGRCVMLETVRFVRLDGDPASALAQLDAEYAGPPPTRVFELPDPRFADKVEDFRRWVALVEQGAHDLGCPREQVVPGFWPGKVTIPVAEGCGQRATYLPTTKPPFVVQSMVRIAPR